MIFITGDTHGDIDYDKLRILKDIPVSYDDYLIICGDAGICWHPLVLPAFLRKYNDIGCTIIFVDGNHENFDMLEDMQLVEYKSALMHRIDKHIFHVLRGEIMTLDSITFLCIGGAASIDKAWRTPHLSWWPQEDITKHDIDNAIENLRKIDNKVDYVITHCLDTKTLTQTFGYKKDNSTNWLNFIDKVVKYKCWFFGHYHEDKWITKKKICLYRNIYQIIDNKGNLRVISQNIEGNT